MTGWKKTAVIGAVFGFMFVFGLLATFPMSVVARIVEAQAEKALDHKYAISIGSARYSFPLGLKLRQVSIESTGELMPGEVRLPTNFDSARVGVALFPLLTGRVKATADLRMGDGRVVASWGPGGEGHEMKLEVRRLRLDRIDLLRQMTGMPMIGQMDADIRLEYNAEMRLSAGEIEVAIPRFQMGPGAVKCADACRQIGGAIPIGSTDFGPLAIRAAIERSTLNLARFESAGEDVQLELGGRVDLRDPIRASRVDVNLRLALDSRYVEDNGLGPALGRIPMMRNAQTANGYMLRISGVLRNLRTEAAAGPR